MNKHKIFRGVRNILEGEPDDWLGQESVLRSLGITNIHSKFISSLFIINTLVYNIM